MKKPYCPLTPQQEMVVTTYLSYSKQGNLLPGSITEPSEKPGISIIIPMLNEEKNVKFIVRSIQNQTYHNVEIVCVDDFSTDNTPNILKELQKEDKRITIIRNKKNRGVLYSRIYGALHSKGEYIAFADADDAYCQPKILEDIYNVAKEKKVDIVHFQSCGGSFDGEQKFENLVLFFTFNPLTFDKIVKQPELRDNFFQKKKNVSGSGYVFDKLYSRDTIIRLADEIGEDIWNQHLVFVDDFLLVYAGMRVANSIIMINNMGFWHWMDNDMSVTSNFFDIKGFKLEHPEKTNKKLKDLMIIKEKIFDMTENDPESGEVREDVLRDMEQPVYIDIIVRSIHKDRLLNIYSRFIKWKYIKEDQKKRIMEGARFIISHSLDPKLMYSEFYSEEDTKKDDNKLIKGLNLDVD